MAHHTQLRTSRVSLACLLLLVVAFIASPALAQSWTGPARASGTVKDSNGKAIPGAVVQLSLPDGSDDRPPAVTTDKKGRWSVLGIRPGPWLYSVKADGFLEAKDSFGVRGQGPTPPVAIVLASKDSTPDIPAPTSQSTADRLKAANAMLEDGKPAEARAEYLAVLGKVTSPEQPAILRAIARSHFLEGNVEKAISELRRALTHAPLDGDSRQLYEALLAQQERSGEAEALYAEMAALGIQVPGDPMAADPAQAAQREANMLANAERIRRREHTPLEPGAKGLFRAKLTEKSPLANGAAFVERFGGTLDHLRRVDPDAGEYVLADESFFVLVPDSYEPNAGWGALVWISPTIYGGATERTLGVLAQHKLIWIGAHFAGNQRFKWDRYHLALDAAYNLQKAYDLDSERIYVGGYSGGGRASSIMAMLYPEVFRGAFSFMGADYFRAIPVPGRPGAAWQPAYPEPSRDELKALRTSQRFVLLTGEKDFNRDHTRGIRDQMKKDGFRQVTYLEVPGATHYTPVPPETIAEGLRALDEPVKTTRPR